MAQLCRRAINVREEKRTKDFLVSPVTCFSNCTKKLGKYPLNTALVSLGNKFDYSLTQFQTRRWMSPAADPALLLRKYNGRCDTTFTSKSSREVYLCGDVAEEHTCPNQGPLTGQLQNLKTPHSKFSLRRERGSTCLHKHRNKMVHLAWSCCPCSVPRSASGFQGK